MTRQHRTAVFTGSRGVGLESRELVAPGPDLLLVRIEGCGVCGSDFPVWEGRPWFEYPREAGSPGHEAWGTVESLGEGTQGPAPGTRVALLSHRSYAQYETVAADQVVELPPALAGRPFPGEPLGCAMNVFERSGVEAGQTVAVVGVGFLGAVLVRLCAEAGARVIALSRRPFALELARELGAAEVVGLADPHDALERVRSLTSGEGCERVIECVGRQQPLDLAGELCAVRGRLVIAGYHQDGTRQVNLQLWNWRGLDVINAHERDPARYAAGARAAAEAVAAGRLDPDRLYTHRYPLERLGEAFEAAQLRPEGFLKALVLP